MDEMMVSPPNSTIQNANDQTPELPRTAETNRGCNGEKTPQNNSVVKHIDNSIFNHISKIVNPTAKVLQQNFEVIRLSDLIISYLADKNKTTF